MADRSKQPAVLLRKIDRREALLAAEQQAHDKTREAYREKLYEAVELRLRHEHAMAALQGGDDE